MYTYDRELEGGAIVTHIYGHVVDGIACLGVHCDCNGVAKKAWQQVTRKVSLS